MNVCHWGGTTLLHREMKSQAGVHVSIATELNRTIDRYNLQAVGRLEQDVVFGDGTGKEVTSFFQEFPQLPSTIKVDTVVMDIEYQRHQ